MAFVAVATFITAGNKTAASTRTLATSATVEVGNLAVLAISCDNLTTTDGNTNNVTSVTDVRSNTWVKALEYTNGEGAAGSGITSALFYCVPTTQLTSGDNITINFSASLTAVQVKGSEFSKGAGTTIAIDGTGQEAVDAGDPGSITLTGANSGEHLWVRVISGETATTTFSSSSGYSKVNAAATSGGAADTNVMCGWEYKISTGTGSGASNPSATTADWASVMVGLIEVSTQDITGVSFTNTQTFGAGVVTTSYDITGASFTNSQSFGTGVLTTQYDITGASFANSQTFGAGVISQGSSDQNIIGASFTNTNLFGSAVISGGEVLDTVSGVNDGNSFSPRPRKLKQPQQFVVPVVKSQETEAIVDRVLTPAIEEIRISLKQIEQENQDLIITQKAKEIADYIESPVIQSALSAISHIESKQIQEKIALEVSALLSELKQKRLEIQAKQVESDLNTQLAALDHKKEQIEKLQKRVSQLNEYKKRYAEKLQRDGEEEELALMYLMFDS